MAQAGAHAGALELGDGVDEALLLGADRRVLRGVGVGEVRPDPGDLDDALGPRARDRGDDLGPVGEDAVAAQTRCRP